MLSRLRLNHRTKVVENGPSTNRRRGEIGIPVRLNDFVSDLYFASFEFIEAFAAGNGRIGIEIVTIVHRKFL